MRIEVEPIPGEPPLHNLLASAVHLTGDPDNRWYDGITWEEQSCAEVYTFRQICNQTAAVTGNDGAGGIGTSDADTYYLPYVCEATGTDQAKVRKRNEDRLSIGAIKKFEAKFWADSQAAIPNNDGRSDTSGVLNASFTTPVAVSPEVGLLALTQALANCSVGARGMIHAVPYLVETWTLRNYLCMDDAGRLVTRTRGDIVVAGSGYTGAGPIGSSKQTPDDGTSWAFATPMVGVRWSGIEHDSTSMSVIVDRSTNLVRWNAKQTIVAQVDRACCNYAVLVDVP